MDAIKPHLHLIFPTEIVEVHKKHLSWCGIERDLEHYKRHKSKRQHGLERMSVPVAIAFIGVNQGVNQGVQVAKALGEGAALCGHCTAHCEVRALSENGGEV